MYVTEGQLKNIVLNCGNQVANITIEGGNLKIKYWIEKITLRLWRSASDEMIDMFVNEEGEKEDRQPLILISKTENIIQR